MSIGARVIFVVGNVITRVPVQRFERLFLGDPDEAMPEYAGQRLRCAYVLVEIEKRKPVRILRVDYVILPFGPDGRMAEDGRRRRDALVGEIAGGLVARVSGTVADFGPHLARRQYQSEFKWQPTPEQAETVGSLALAR